MTSQGLEPGWVFVAPQVIKAAIKKGVRVILATGKARPAAIQACKKFGLEGAQIYSVPLTL